MTERERIVEEMAHEMQVARQYMGDRDLVYDRFWVILASAALRVIERKSDPQTADYSRICTCDQSGYPENSPHSNHPHREGCPQYTGRYDD